MDSKIGDWVVTPRHGKPVEIQALWYSALRVMEDLAGRFGDGPTHAFVQELAHHTKGSFNDQFWNDESGCLCDVVDGGSRDGSIRPNQIFAASLTHSMLPTERACQVVEVVRRELLTPLGLRSLSPRDSRYRPTYEGGVFERDSAYHQGTVWPWLMGPFITAFVKVNGASPGALDQVASWLRGLESHIRNSGLGHISEICDGDSPHRARGCVAQAWSVAELLRAAAEDVFVRSDRSAATA
jgi:glycogen debranching enzyme